MLTMYKDFVRSHLNYSDIIYDQAYNETFHQKLKLIQILTALIGAIRGTSNEKIYEELGLESLHRPVFSTAIVIEKYLIFLTSTKMNFCSIFLNFRYSIIQF